MHSSHLPPILLTTPPCLNRHPSPSCSAALQLLPPPPLTSLSYPLTALLAPCAPCSTMEAAFSDLAQLMGKAEEMVALAQYFRERMAAKKEGGQGGGWHIAFGVRCRVGWQLGSWMSEWGKAWGRLHRPDNCACCPPCFPPASAVAACRASRGGGLRWGGGAGCGHSP